MIFLIIYSFVGALMGEVYLLHQRRTGAPYSATIYLAAYLAWPYVLWLVGRDIFKRGGSGGGPCAT